MRPRSLAPPAVVLLLLVAGCTGSSPVASETATTDSTATTATTTRPCSLDGTSADYPTVSKPASLTAKSAAEAAKSFESAYQSVRIDSHTYFNHHLSESSVERTDGGFYVSLDGELDYDGRGGPNATVTHVHRPYTVTYRVTGRQLVRRGEAGTSGTVFCW